MNIFLISSILQPKLNNVFRFWRLSIIIIIIEPITLNKAIATIKVNIKYDIKFSVLITL